MIIISITDIVLSFSVDASFDDSQWLCRLSISITDIMTTLLRHYTPKHSPEPTAQARNPTPKPTKNPK